MDSSGYFKSGCWTLVVAFAVFSIACVGAADDFGLFAVLLSLIFLAVIIAVIFWIVGAAKAVKETYVAVRDTIIDIFTVKREIKQKCPEALKAMILEKKKHSINVGVFNYENTMYEKVEISGPGVVNDDIYEGQTIIL